jgi:hypothetical protein
MIEHAIAPFIDQVDNIQVVILKEHNDKFDIENSLKNLYNYKVTVTVLDGIVNGPAKSAAMALSTLSDRSIFIKDCDNIFELTISNENFVCVIENETDPAKSYVQINNIITKIAEKELISTTACAGGYGFRSSIEFVNTVNNINKTNEIYISDVVSKLLTNCFKPRPVNNYVDLGTLDRYIKFNNQYI